jgi:hypothetical protein
MTERNGAGAGPSPTNEVPEAVAQSRERALLETAISGALYQLADEASVCWAPKPGGVFDAVRAQAAAQRAASEVAHIVVERICERVSVLTKELEERSDLHAQRKDGMKAVPFPASNRTFQRPKDMTEDECSALDVHDTGEGFISCWDLGAADRARIARGGPIWLWVLGRAHPPVLLQTENPFRPDSPVEDAPSERAVLEMLVVGPLHELAGAASMCWDPKPSSQVFDARAAQIEACETATRVAKLVQQAYAATDDARDAKLGRELVAILEDHVGPGPDGMGEGAVEVLRRLIDEREKYRAEVRNQNARNSIRCDHPRRKTALEDGLTTCTDCGLSMIPVFWNGKLPEGARITSPEEIRERVREQLALKDGAVVMSYEAGATRYAMPIAPDYRPARTEDVQRDGDARSEALAKPAGAACETGPGLAGKQAAPADDPPYPSDEDLLSD